MIVDDATLTLEPLMEAKNVFSAVYLLEELLKCLSRFLTEGKLHYAHEIIYPFMELINLYCFQSELMQPCYYTDLCRCERTA